MRHRLAAHGVEQRCRVCLIVRTGIKDRHLAPTDNITHRAREGERAGIIAENPPHAWNDFVHHAGLERKIAIERYLVAYRHRNTQMHIQSSCPALCRVATLYSR